MLPIKKQVQDQRMGHLLQFLIGHLTDELKVEMGMERGTQAKEKNMHSKKHDRGV